MILIQQKRYNTKIGELDNNLSNEYGLSEANEAFIMADFQALQDATGKAKTPPRSTIMPRRTGKVKSIRCKQDYINNHRNIFRSKTAGRRKKNCEGTGRACEQAVVRKTWDVVCDFTGEVTGYYDYKRAADGVDPVTGEKLTAGQRVAAGEWLLQGIFQLSVGPAVSLKAEKQSIQLEKRYTRLIKPSKYIKLPKPFMHWKVLKKGFMA